jgi:hypothetical protein
LVLRRHNGYLLQPPGAYPLRIHLKIALSDVYYATDLFKIGEVTITVSELPLTQEINEKVVQISNKRALLAPAF